jgi:hypothetical protein
MVPALCLAGCSNIAVNRKTKSITAEEAYEVLDSAFQSCCYNGEMKYTVSNKTTGQPILATDSKGNIEFSQNTDTDTNNRRSVNLILDDILYSRVVDIDRQTGSTTITLVRSEPECYYSIIGTTDTEAESGFEGLTWNLQSANKVVRTIERMDPLVMLYSVCFEMISELTLYDESLGTYTGCNGTEYDWVREDEDGIVILKATGKTGEDLDNLFLDNYPDVDAVAESFDVTESTYTITINEDEQLVTIDYETDADYKVDNKKYDFTNTGTINFLAYSNRIPSYGTINKLIDDLAFSENTNKPTKDVKTFIY